MAKDKKKNWFFVIVLLFLIYFLGAARPIPPETGLKAAWLSSLDSGETVFWDAYGMSAESSSSVSQADARNAIPFVLGEHFGYVDLNGGFAVNRIARGKLSLSAEKWAEYDAVPSEIVIQNKFGELIETIDKPHGYPLFLDGRSFIISSEQNALSETDGRGQVRWTHEFGAPLTRADAAAGFVLAGSIDGVVTVLGADGTRIFEFAPGGSRYAVILGCAFSRDAARFAVVCGIDKQRFLLFERFGASGSEYKIIYHEFLGEGYRRPVHVSFIDRDRRVVFEREGGLGIYEINSRRGYTAALEGEVAFIDDFGGDGLLFAIMRQPSSETKTLVGIMVPNKIFMSAPFSSPDVFLGRSGSRLFIGGGSTLASFELEKQ